MDTKLSHTVRLYVPDCPKGMLAQVKDWLLASEVTGFTQWSAQGSWHDGQAWIDEPVTVIECWVASVPDMTPYLDILAIWSQMAGFYVVDGTGHLVDLTQRKAYSANRRD